MYSEEPGEQRTERKAESRRVLWSENLEAVVEDYQDSKWGGKKDTVSDYQV